MKRIIQIAIGIVIGVLLIKAFCLGILYLVLNSDDPTAEHKIVESYSPSKMNKIDVYQIGSYGTKIKIKYGNKTITDSTSNDGGMFSSGQVLIDWIDEDHAVVNIDPEEELPKEYPLTFDK